MKAAFKQKNISLLKPFSNNECVSVCVWVSVCVCPCIIYPSMQSASFYTALHCRCVTCLAVPLFFSHYLINATIFGKKVIEHKLCVLSLSTAFVWNISHSKSWARCDKNVYCSLYKVPVIHIRFKLNLIFSYRFSRNTQIWNFVKIRPLGAQFHAERQTDWQTDGRTEGHKYDEDNSGFLQFCESD
jgi:hypothetical protein